ncbi:hypothetical protein AAE478_002322 [Parahypoxylon ruwenzoriense]
MNTESRALFYAMKSGMYALYEKLEAHGLWQELVALMRVCHPTLGVLDIFESGRKKKLASEQARYAASNETIKNRIMIANWQHETRLVIFWEHPRFMRDGTGNLQENEDGIPVYIHFVKAKSWRNRPISARYDKALIFRHDVRGDFEEMGVRDEKQ